MGRYISFVQRWGDDFINTAVIGKLIETKEKKIYVHGCWCDIGHKNGYFCLKYITKENDKTICQKTVQNDQLREPETTKERKVFCKKLEEKKQPVCQGSFNFLMTIGEVEIKGKLIIKQFQDNPKNYFRGMVSYKENEKQKKFKNFGGLLIGCSYENCCTFFIHNFIESFKFINVFCQMKEVNNSIEKMTGVLHNKGGIIGTIVCEKSKTDLIIFDVDRDEKIRMLRNIEYLSQREWFYDASSHVMKIIK